MNRLRIAGIVGCGIVLAASIVYLGYARNTVEPDTAHVARVIDGDTIVIDGGGKIRYLGIDTPETVDRRKSVQCFGPQASTRNKALVEGRIIRLERDITGEDRYDRALRYVWVGDMFVNLELVREGYAVVNWYHTKRGKYAKLFNEAEREARDAKRGLWGACASTANSNIPKHRMKKKS